MTNHDTAIEAIAANERDKARRAALEAFWAAYKAHEADPRNVTRRLEIAAARAVEATEK